MPRTLHLPFTLLLAMALIAPAAFAQPHDDVEALFQTQLSDYLLLRDRLRQGVAPEHIIDPRIREISGALLAVQIQRARANAQPCDVIPAALADIVRDRLHRALDDTEVDILLMNIYPDGLPTEPARINARYDDRVALAPPVSVLSALPPLPGALGYRLIGRDLALWDEEAHLVIDVIVDALPQPRVWKFLDVSSLQLLECVRQALTAANIDARELATDLARDASPDATRPSVGELFDWDTGGMMPPSILHALPSLPRPLEYRFAGSDLVVIDVESGYVQGILWDVLPRRATDRHCLS